jgi:hypothetical protein
MVNLRPVFPAAAFRLKDSQVLRFAPLGLCAALAAIATPAAAGTITLSDRASVASALGGGALVENFTDFTNGPYCTISTGVLNAATAIAAGSFCSGITPGLIQAGVTYSAAISAGKTFNIDGFASFPGGFLDGLNGNKTLDVAFDLPQSAFGFDTNKLMGSSFAITFDFSDGSHATQTLTVPGTSALTGFGFTSSSADITGATIVAGGANFALDNFTYGPGTAVPEPASILLLAGFLGAGLLVRRAR